MQEILNGELTSQRIKADTIAGITVLFITIPQVIAYAFLAGMPAQAGLYAALVALCLYAILGSSKVLAVGPTAIVAMMTLQITSTFSEPGTAEYVAVATKLALLTGGLLLILRAIRFGYIISLLSHAVVAGFITAAAVLIIGNQFPTALGLQGLREMNLAAQMIHLGRQLANLNTGSLGISLASVVSLVLCKLYLANGLAAMGLRPENASVHRLISILMLITELKLSAPFQLDCLRLHGYYPAWTKRFNCCRVPF